MANVRFQLEHTAVLVVDVQEKLLPHIHNAGQVQQQVGRLIDGANVLGVPVMVTEQYRKGLGATVAGLVEKMSKTSQIIEKTRFSACTDDMRKMLYKNGIRCVIVCGIEAHVCVLQTCLDLVGCGYLTAVAVDAIGSRRELDQTVAVGRMVQAGIVPATVESVLLEIVGEAATDRFKAVLPIIK